MTIVAATDNSRRRPKGDKRARTRAALLEAARELIRDKGYERTTMEEVARRAGMTGGALYGNFKNRDELFIALGQTYWPPIKPKIRPGSSFADKMRALAEAAIAAIPERRVAAAGRLTKALADGRLVLTVDPAGTPQLASAARASYPNLVAEVAVAIAAAAADGAWPLRS